MLISRGQIREGSFVFIEKNSKKVFEMNVKINVDTMEIFLKGDKFSYNEKYISFNNSYFLTKRVFKVGVLSYDLKYYPKRLRFLLPFDKNQKWEYEGIEKSSIHKVKIKSNGFVYENETGYRVFNITFRNDSSDTSVIEFDKNYTIKKISIQLPDLFLLKEMLGFKTSKLVFEDYGKE